MLIKDGALTLPDFQEKHLISSAPVKSGPGLHGFTLLSRIGEGRLILRWCGILAEDSANVTV